MTTISFLHTHDLHENTFDNLVSEIQPDIEQSHAVHAEWLQEARETGMSEDLQKRIKDLLIMQAGQSDAVLCTCSTIGTVADEVSKTHKNVIRIDRPLMAKAAEIGGNVVVALCLESTLEPTLNLLKESFEMAGKEFNSRTALCAEAWPLFEAGKSDEFAEAIAKIIEDICNDETSCVVLAQASMAGAAAHLDNLGIPVLSSPKLAAEAVVAKANA